MRTGLKALSDADKQFFNKMHGYPIFQEKGRAKKRFAVDVSCSRRFTRSGIRPIKAKALCETAGLRHALQIHESDPKIRSHL